MNGSKLEASKMMYAGVLQGGKRTNSPGNTCEYNIHRLIRQSIIQTVFTDKAILIVTISRTLIRCGALQRKHLFSDRASHIGIVPDIFLNS